ncbi:hypothetical protein DSCO28_47210 [Desulfosarcina ovata subsp. sediminis]|uniref:Guanylate cyclase domain-containing protein n=2 Tax=Desulfosarcina ovata TaxID=83564 RepID=A0A5K8ADH2_9BACT|nr:hypothetical protein DSCO28_47210 [Desulfosarcina ovata subsp. sediminis]BBO90665.1 hypothetical protein DSCOOX_38450 [Desulfosarcina ovata subsp. ovata]
MVLFSDICHYREIIRRVDPEDIREVTRHLFQESVNIIERYGGYIDRMLWDGLMAVFGMPCTHEDDVVRAIRAALDIRRMAERLGRAEAGCIGEPLSMRSGIAYGLVVTGVTQKESGRPGLTGDTVNLAARLRDLASPGEVLAESGTFSSAAGFFRFEALPAVAVKGREAPIAVFRVADAVVRPEKVRRVHGLKTRLIARGRELKQMRDAALRLHRQAGTVLTICGDAGTGKSRLIAEFKASTRRSRICWLDGYAYTYTRAVPYYPFIDMLNRFFDIDEADGDTVILQKLHAGLGRWVADGDTVASYLAGFYTPSSLETVVSDQEVFKSRLQQAVTCLLSVLSRKAPTIVCLEDLHWADPSSLSLIRCILREPGLPLMFVISYRSSLNFAHGENGERVSHAWEHIHLRDLDVAASRAMAQSLIGTRAIPEALDHYLTSRVAGNPFFIEEVINALIDAGRLKRIGNRWHFEDMVAIPDLSSTINSIIHSRLDRLGRNAKAILQEAAVIGRVFHLTLLRRITDFPEVLTACLDQLAGQGLIRRQADPHEPVYRFNYGIVQEVVYNGILKKERRTIYEKIARVLESDGRP